MSYCCRNCNKMWSYKVKKCIFCDSDVEEVNGKKFYVIGFTQVNIPSSAHKEVPYFNYLLEDENSNKRIIKSFDKHEIGDSIEIEEIELLSVD